MSNAESVRASEAKKIRAGGRRLPGGVLAADAARALERLLADGYAASVTGCIARALLDAEQKINSKRSSG